MVITETNNKNKKTETKNRRIYLYDTNHTNVKYKKNELQRLYKNRL